MTEPVAHHETTDAPAREYEVRPELPVHRCEYCGQPFSREEWLALHWGLEHPAALDDEEADAFREAHADEEAALRTFRLKALGALLVLYFGLLMIYAVV